MRLVALWLTLFLALMACRREHAESSGEGAQTSEDSKLVVDEGCPRMVKGECSHATPEGAPPESEKGTQLYGEPLGTSPTLSLASILESPSSFHAKKVLVSGHVSRACSRKGCWMELATDESPEAARCRVTFKDYAFFVPTNSAGKSARLEGVVEVTEVKAEAVSHYESEGASFRHKQGDGSAREVRIVATGVELGSI